MEPRDFAKSEMESIWSIIVTKRRKNRHPGMMTVFYKTKINRQPQRKIAERAAEDLHFPTATQTARTEQDESSY